MANFNKNNSTWEGHPIREDLTDFACSEFWRNHYFDTGYSSWRTGRAKPKQQYEAIRALEVEIHMLRDRMSDLVEEVRQLPRGSFTHPKPRSQPPFTGIALKEFE